MGAHICFDRHIHIANKTWSKGVLRHLGYEDIDEQTGIYIIIPLTFPILQAFPPVH